MRLLVCFFLATIALWNGTKITRSDDEWRSLLGRERYCILRKKATEHAFSGHYLHTAEPGIYQCAGCQLAVFDSSKKIDMDNGWLNFHSPVIQRHVWIKKDYSLSFLRYEVLCRGCDGHLGHVFKNGANSNLRYTINSLAVNFIPTHVE